MSKLLNKKVLIFIALVRRSNFELFVASKETAVLFCFVAFEMFDMNENKKTEEKLSFIVRSCVFVCKKRTVFLRTSSLSKMVMVFLEQVMKFAFFFTTSKHLPNQNRLAFLYVSFFS